MTHDELTHLIALLDPQAPTNVVDDVVEKLSQLCSPAEERFFELGRKAKENQPKPQVRVWDPNDPTNW